MPGVLHQAIKTEPEMTGGKRGQKAYTARKHRKKKTQFAPGITFSQTGSLPLGVLYNAHLSLTTYAQFFLLYLGSSLQSDSPS